MILSHQFGGTVILAIAMWLLGINFDKVSASTANAVMHFDKMQMKSS